MDRDIRDITKHVATTNHMKVSLHTVLKISMPKDLDLKNYTIINAFLFPCRRGMYLQNLDIFILSQPFMMLFQIETGSISPHLCLVKGLKFRCRWPHLPPFQTILEFTDNIFVFSNICR